MKIKPERGSWLMAIVLSSGVQCLQVDSGQGFSLLTFDMFLLLRRRQDLSSKKFFSIQFQDEFSSLFTSQRPTENDRELRVV
jgi:hypothetical protein